MVDKTTPSENLLRYVVRIVVWLLIILGVVLAVDAFTLLLLNRLTDVGTWLPVLLFEGAAMAFVGGAVWGKRLPYNPNPKGAEHLFRIRKNDFKYPWFLISFGMTGFVLLVITAYLFWRYY